MTDHDVVSHMIDCRKIDAALVGDTGVDMTPTVDALIAAGWVLEGSEVVDGKRIRYLIPPAGNRDVTMTEHEPRHFDAHGVCWCNCWACSTGGSLDLPPVCTCPGCNRAACGLHDPEATR